MKVALFGSSEIDESRWKSDGAVIVMPFTDALQATRSAHLMAARSGTDGLVLAIHDDQQEGFISIANRIFSATDSPFFGYVAQDAFAGRFWLHHAVRAFENPCTHLVAFNDGKWFGALAAYGLVRRSWAQRIYDGQLFFPRYARHYADTELSLIAAQQEALHYAANSVLIEVDWKKDALQVSETDHRLFQTRVKTGFDGRVTSKSLLERFI